MLLINLFITQRHSGSLINTDAKYVFILKLFQYSDVREYIKSRLVCFLRNPSFHVINRYEVITKTKKLIRPYLIAANQTNLQTFAGGLNFSPIFNCTPCKADELP